MRSFTKLLLAATALYGSIWFGGAASAADQDEQGKPSWVAWSVTLPTGEIALFNGHEGGVCTLQLKDSGRTFGFLPVNGSSSPASAQIRSFQLEGSAIKELGAPDKLSTQLRVWVSEARGEVEPLEIMLRGVGALDSVGGTAEGGCCIHCSWGSACGSISACCSPQGPCCTPYEPD